MKQWWSVRTFSLVVLLHALTAVAGNYLGAQSSVLATGSWFRVAVDKPGVYRIDFSSFRAMGFDPNNTDPRRIKIYTQGSGMLPQANNQDRKIDLQEIAIHIQGEQDGIFHQQDFILFYAEGADRISYDVQKDIFRYEKHLYEKSNYYFITVADSPGKRIGESPNLSGNFPQVREYDAFTYHEIDRVNVLRSGRDWFGEAFATSTELTLRFPVSGIVSGSPIKLVSAVMASGFGTTRFDLFFNGVAAGQQVIAGIPNTQYGIKGRQVADTISLNATQVLAADRTTQEIRYRYDRSGLNSAVGYLDYLLLQVKQQLRFQANQLIFRSTASLQQGASTFIIDGSASGNIVWDVTNPFEPQWQQLQVAEGSTRFSTSTDQLKTFIVFNTSVPAPKLVGRVANQNIKGQPAPASIIVTHRDFFQEAVRLKNHRETHSGLTTLVVTTDEVFYEFSGGKQDVSAIRDMARYFYQKSPGLLKGILLFGKGSYDYKDILTDNKNFVPTYQSRNSLNPLQTYSSDDYFGFLEDQEGEWSESPAQNHTMDIAVGRLPVISVEQARTVVDKIIRYETDLTLSGRWRQQIAFVADDGDFNIHQLQADAMARFIDSRHARYSTQRVYLDAFEQLPGISGETSPETRRQLGRTFNNGALIVNYTGHGNERLWTAERILDEVFIQQLKNTRWPLVITATCEFGRQDDPQFPSGAELLMLQPAAGAIGVVTTARPVNSATNFELNQAWYQAFFTQEDGKNLLLGEIFRRTKNSSVSGVANRNFSLIGDPMMKLAMPQQPINITSVQTASGDTVLKALSRVFIQGEVLNFQGYRDTDFNGIAQATLFDKPVSFVTRGNENPPFTFTQWSNALFRGQASVTEGQFTFEFIMPKNMAYAVDAGKLSIYAFQSGGKDASGYSMDFTVGDSEPSPGSDANPPSIKLFLGDETFVSGGLVNPSTRLIARLQDDSGISVSGYGIGNSIVATIDDQESFVLNDYYLADRDDYRNGTIDFPLEGLSPGHHILTLKAWDTFNNPGQASIAFTVTESGKLVIEEFAGYPNPFQTSTQLYFRHNQSGADLEAKLLIYDLNGRILQSVDYVITDSPYEVSLLTLDRDDDFIKNLGQGMYLSRLIVRSLADGSYQERVTKLILN